MNEDSASVSLVLVVRAQAGRLRHLKTPNGYFDLAIFKISDIRRSDLLDQDRKSLRRQISKNR